MEELPTDLRDFLQNQPLFQVTDNKKIKCTLNGHEFPCNLSELQKFTSGNKFKKLSASASFNYSQYEPHLVPSTKEPNHLFCKLTLRHLNRSPEHVLRHINGKRFKKALTQYEECVKQGVKFVPAKLRQRQKPKDSDDGMESNREDGHNHKQDKGFWAPSSSGEDSDSDDSMSDLYPSSLFTLKKPHEKEEMKEDKDEDDFQTDEDEMDISEMDDKKQATQKRKKVQTAGFYKKLKKNKKRKGFKAISKVKK